MTIKNDLEKKLEFKPTKSLKLDISLYYKSKSGGLIEYLKTHSNHSKGYLK